MSEKLDIVLPLGPSSIDHMDLRYTLRSIEKNVKNYRDIWIIGELPHWITGVKNLPHSDEWHPRWHEKNIWKKFTAASIVPEISDTFLATNDDIVFIDKVDASKYPFYYKGTCRESIEKNHGVYKKTMKHTLNFLIGRGFDDRNFDTHTPIRYEKKKFLSTFAKVHWETPYGYGVKSVYCAVNRISGEYMPDLKFRKPQTLQTVEDKLKDRHVFSFDDRGMPMGVTEWLEKEFSVKSKYEI